MRVLTGGQAHPVEAQAGHGDYLPAVVTACNALRKTADLEKQVCARFFPDTVSLSFPNPDPVRLHNDQLTRVVLLGRVSQREGDQLDYQGGSGLRAVQDLKGDDTFELGG